MRGVRELQVGLGGVHGMGRWAQEGATGVVGRWLRGGDGVVGGGDGYATDAPGTLPAALAAIRERGARIGWLHPTVQIPQSEAMQAAAHLVYRFMPAHNLASLARLHEMVA